MGLNKPSRNEVAKEAEKRDYTWNADKTKMTNENGGWLKFSETGQSVRTNVGNFNSSSDAKKSSRW